MMEDNTLTTLRLRRNALLEYRDSLKLKKLNNQLINKGKPLKTYTLSSYNHSKSLIESYSRLPVLDINKRLKFARLTCPWMAVENVSKTAEFDNSKSHLCFNLKFENCGIFDIEIHIDNKKKCIDDLKINIVSLQPIDEEGLIRSLIAESTESFDLSSFVYRMNTLLRMRHKRKRVWTNVLDELNLEKVTAVNGFPLSGKMDKQKLATVIFDNSPSVVRFKTKTFTLIISWNILFTSTRRQCVSDFTATLKGKSITKLLKSLIKSKDVKLATLQLLNL